MRLGTICHREEDIVTLKLLSVPTGQSERDSVYFAVPTMFHLPSVA